MVLKKRWSIKSAPFGIVEKMIEINSNKKIKVFVATYTNEGLKIEWYTFVLFEKRPKLVNRPIFYPLFTKFLLYP